ncbi:Lysophospholipase, alpha-beta hydrolase superfamily [Bowdeniella nasicola]|uniref:Lysophospholipase, alpha-beta hydrolase superfamily n=1 Tax=Bowdeniella nasicola TaxID=208480 RepID=A0A1H3ZP52_9ACTO|nr:alpha/beta hydrolase [Bowdeniella nasicola]SEA25546.1 Lysophospholipase, alpha-beta hydrolase superfamily [Bowdeniella nasicola]
MNLSELPRVPDILDGYISRQFRVTEAPSMPRATTATLVHHAELLPDAQRAILYLPGYSDYFFQTEHATAWRKRGFEFFALDMRAQGRNLLPGPRSEEGPLPEYLPDLRIRHEDIALAMRALRERYDQIAILGHSTGGLQAVMYAYLSSPAAHPTRSRGLPDRTRHPLAPDALILNSPWFGLNANPLTRLAAPLGVAALARIAPTQQVATLDPAYTHDLIEYDSGRWGIDPMLKPIDGFPMRAATLASVCSAQRRLARGLHLDIATLICHSARSGNNSHPTADEVATSDVVLDVADMTGRAMCVGVNAQTYAIEDGKHDLALSGPAARETYLRRITDFADLTLFRA